MSPRRPASLLAVAVLTLGVSACSGDPEPIIASPSPSPTSSESATPSPTDDPMVVPGDETAEEFIRRWQEATYEMQRSGDPEPYLSMTRRCSSCDALADSVSSIYADGGSVVGSGGRIKRLIQVGKSEGVLIFEYVLRSLPSKILDRNGGVKQEFTGGTNRYQVNVDRAQGGWFVLSISRLTG